jgi:glyoxylase-like metal-dependent hydrolase (beta-lactamase superfamily II)
VPRDRVLFSGDCLINGYTPNLDCGKQLEWQQWLVSLGRLARLAPSVVVAGHGPVTMGSDVARIIATVRQELEHSIVTGRSPTSC